jgi:tRNA (guanine-N7-)-methyltransferase
MTNPLTFYGRRKGRALGAQKQSLMETLLPLHQVTLEEAPQLMAQAPYSILEIGFGGGEHLATQAVRKPHATCLGVEVFHNGIASLLEAIKKNDLKNVFIYPDDGRPLLAKFLEKTIDELFLLFPDPWPKKKHHERRLLSGPTLAHFSHLLKPTGTLTIASDDPSYLEHIQECLEASPHFQLFLENRKSIYERPQPWVITRYEEKALLEGRVPHYFTLKLKNPL